MLTRLDNERKNTNLDYSKIKRLEFFLEKIKNDTYPEAPTSQHTSITRKMIDLLMNKYFTLKEGNILDVGCGQGVAIEYFTNKGFSTIGITLNNEDLQKCKEKGHEIYEMDQSFLDFDDEEFDLVWCRHCLEHSIFPYFTLGELFRVLKHGGCLSVEVLAPDTDCKHQTNQNHYSVLGKSMWIELMKRTGFTLVDFVNIDLKGGVPWKDVYWAFILQKS